MRGVVIAGLLMGLAGCASGASAPAGKLLTFTKADLQNAVALATAAGPEGAEIVSCFGFLEGQIDGLIAVQGGASGATVGLATAFTIADLGIGSFAAGAYETACGPLVLHVQNQGVGLLAQVQALQGLLGGGIVP